MPKSPADRLPFEVRDSLPTTNHDPTAIVMAIPSDVRDRNLEIILDEMGIGGGADRVAALRDIGDIIFDYWRLRAALEKRLTKAETKDWYVAVHAHASALLELLLNDRAAVDRLPHTVRSSSDLVAGLRAVELNGHFQVATFEQTRARLPRTTKRDFATKRVLNTLDFWFHAVTGKRPTLSHEHHHYGPGAERGGKPTGEFFKVVSAFFALVGERRSPEAVASAIKRRDD